MNTLDDENLPESEDSKKPYARFISYSKTLLASAARLIRIHDQDHQRDLMEVSRQKRFAALPNLKLQKPHLRYLPVETTVDTVVTDHYPNGTIKAKVTWRKEDIPLSQELGFELNEAQYNALLEYLKKKLGWLADDDIYPFVLSCYLTDEEALDEIMEIIAKYDDDDEDDYDDYDDYDDDDDDDDDEEIDQEQKHCP